MSKALIVTILVACIVCVTAQAAGPSLSYAGVTCAGVKLQVICHRDDYQGYVVGAGPNWVIVGRNGKIVFSRQSPGAVGRVLTAKPGAMLYRGEYCSKDISANQGIACLPASLSGYDMEMSMHTLVVLNMSTGHVVFSKNIP